MFEFPSPALPRTPPPLAGEGLGARACPTFIRPDASLDCAVMHSNFLMPVTSPGRVPLPLFASRIAAGFPSPADDYVEARLDLNELLVQRQEATYFLRVKGDSMQGAGIHPGDLIVVDRSIEAQDGSVVVAEVDGALTIKRLRLGGGAPELHPDNPAYPVIRFKEGQELRIWGVVTSSVHTVR
jgi:DNA polymerase V